MEVVAATEGSDTGPSADDATATVFRTPYADEEALLTWVLSMGRRAELLGPPALRRSLIRRLERLEAVHV